MVTCEKMKELERMADAAGLSFYQMMENAGTCATEEILKSCSKLKGGGSAVIFCGKGNNGGDGLVVARLLAQQGTDVKVILAEGDPETPDAITNYGLLEEIPEVEVTDIAGADPFAIDTMVGLALADCDMIVDAIYGTGFHGELRLQAAVIVEAINAAHEAGTQVAALDLPSGLSGNAGVEDEIGPGVEADITVTFHDTKPIHENKQAVAERLGRVIIADIGIGKAIGSAE